MHRQSIVAYVLGYCCPLYDAGINVVPPTVTFRWIQILLFGDPRGCHDSSKTASNTVLDVK